MFTVPPIVTLRLGSTLKPDNIKEGDDVYFECHVKANPAWKKLNWLHNVSTKRFDQSYSYSSSYLIYYFLKKIMEIMDLLEL